MRPSEDAVRPSLEVFAFVPVPPGPCWSVWDRRRMKPAGGEEGFAAHSQAAVPPACFEASGCFALHGGGRTWPRLWVISWQTQQGGCQGVLSSG